jgi:hypothetical protein
MSFMMMSLLSHLMKLSLLSPHTPFGIAKNEVVPRRTMSYGPPCSLGLSATSQQCFPLTTNQSPATSQ